MAEDVTMADFRTACVDRLDYAIESGEQGLQQWQLQSGMDYVRFETPAGIELCRYGGVLTVSCEFADFSGEGGQRKVWIEFVDPEEVPEVIETYSGEDGFSSRTLKKSNHDKVAAELSKFLTLIP